MEPLAVDLIVAIVLILGIAARMPTPSGVRRWLENQLDRLRQQGQFGR